MPNYAQKQHITGTEMKEDSYKRNDLFFCLLKVNKTEKGQGFVKEAEAQWVIQNKGFITGMWCYTLVGSCYAVYVRLLLLHLVSGTKSSSSAMREERWAWSGESRAKLKPMTTNWNVWESKGVQSKLQEQSTKEVTRAKKPAKTNWNPWRQFGTNIPLSPPWTSKMWMTYRSLLHEPITTLHCLLNESLGQKQCCVEYHEGEEDADSGFGRSTAGMNGKSIYSISVYSSENIHCPIH